MPHDDGPSLVGGLLLSLSLAGVNFSSLTVLGGALGLGVGIGLQPLFANFVSGVVLSHLARAA